ncbi:MAG: hypothetical protein ACOVRB_05090 [Akkermansiaceae bacterium]
MKSFFCFTYLILIFATCARGMTIDEAVTLFLKGETISEEEADKVSGRHQAAAEANGINNDGSLYLNSVKMSVISPVRHGGWPYRSSLMDNEREQRKTYNELKAIYEKNPTPMVAYALVCPAMFVNDFKILPELFKKIGENPYLKTHFDQVYAKQWKPRLDPDF